MIEKKYAFPFGPKNILTFIGKNTEVKALARYGKGWATMSTSVEIYEDGRMHALEKQAA